MNTVSKLLASTLIAGSFLFASHAGAQETPTFTPGAGAVWWVDVDVARLATRPANQAGVYGYYIITSAPFTASNVTCLSASANPTNNSWPVVFSNAPDFKLIRETIQLAYALNKKVRIYSGQCVNLQPSTSNYIYPVIWAVETL